MKTTENKSIFLFLLVLVLFSCSKEKRNERDLSGTWILERITTQTFVNNEMVSEKDTTIAGAAMQLLNTDGLDNIAYFVNFQPFPSQNCNWDVNHGKLNSVNFYLMDPGELVMFSYLYNVEKVNRRKLILSIYSSDQDYNQQQKSMMVFKKD